ncbi:MAG TPA: amidohydrolase family protein, partial [Chitinophagaceae bacterium]|nr:amidohydrolase family protein [Chitinophagaceae bacterium]
NWQLSVASEIATIQKHFLHIPVESVLQWATINGAKALQWDKELGGFENGKTSGVVLLSNDGNSQKLA